MADLNAILKNKMGLSVEQAKKSKILASLSGSYRQNMKSIHYSQLVPSTNQFYTEKELEDLADIIQILGGVAQNLLVRKKDAEQYEILAGHRRWRASQIVVQRGFPEYAYLPCLVIECNDDVAELLLILTNSSARNDLNGYEQMMQVVRLKELLPKINKDETLKGRILRKEIALSTKRSESTIQNLMFTAKHLSEDGMQAFREEKLTPAAALYQAKQSKEDQKDLVLKEFFTVSAMKGYLSSKKPVQRSSMSGKEQPFIQQQEIEQKVPTENFVSYIQEPEQPEKKVEKTLSVTQSSKTFSKEKFLFASADHEKRYYETLENVPDPDATVKSLCYCLCLSPNTRDRLENFFDFHAMQPKPECLKNDALSEDDEKAIKMAFNLFSGDTPSINNYGDSINQVKECKSYTVKDLFCSSYAPYFWQAIQIRYPEYTK